MKNGRWETYIFQMVVDSQGIYKMYIIHWGAGYGPGKSGFNTFFNMITVVTGEVILFDERSSTIRSHATLVDTINQLLNPQINRGKLVGGFNIFEKY